MEDYTEQTTVEGNITTTIFTKDGTLVYRRVVSAGSPGVEKWYIAEDKRRCNDDMPAVIHYKDGKITSQCWHKDGRIMRQYWYKHGMAYREIGPCCIQTMDDGLIKNYWYTGIHRLDYLDVPEERRLSPEFRQAMRRLPLPIGDAIAWHFMEIWQFVDVD